MLGATFWTLRYALHFFSTHNFFGLYGGASPADLPPATEIRANARANDDHQRQTSVPRMQTGSTYGTVCTISTQTIIMYGATLGAGDFWLLSDTYKELGGSEGDEGSELLRLTPAFLPSFSHLQVPRAPLVPLEGVCALTPLTTQCLDFLTQVSPSRTLDARLRVATFSLTVLFPTSSPRAFVTKDVSPHSLYFPCHHCLRVAYILISEWAYGRTAGLSSNEGSI